MLLRAYRVAELCANMHKDNIEKGIKGKVLVIKLAAITYKHIHNIAIVSHDIRQETVNILS